MNRVSAIVVMFAAVVFTIGSISHVAQAQTQTNGVEKQSYNTYAAKFICGVQPQSAISAIPDAQAGRYSTKINVHNNTGITISFRKKIIRLRGSQLPESEVPTDPAKVKPLDTLKEDQALEIVCRDIYKVLNITIPSGSIPPYIEGFVILEAYYNTSRGKPPLTPQDPLDVIGVYTYKGDLPAIGPNPPTGSGVSIEVVVYPAKNNPHILH